MNTTTLENETVAASVEISRFAGAGAVEEIHLVVRPTGYAGFEAQLDAVERAYLGALDDLGLGAETAVLRRFFCSDLVNQAPALETRRFANRRDRDNPCAVSWVCQAPVPDGKVALWAYHVADPSGALDKMQEETTLTLRRGETAHHWTTGVYSTEAESSYDQTRAIFEKYNAYLRERNLTLLDNVARTWLFVQNVDANYHGLVVARREFFVDEGLTPETHFIASSGIEGASADPAAKVHMDAYAVSGLRPEQVEYLQAPDHLGPTYKYGVTFERATALAWRDRKHVIVSGTASIDPEGNILHPGDVSRQLDRTIDNIESLLAQAGAGLGDMRSLIVYVRDPSDHALARRRTRERFADCPFVVVQAPVCRPGWLIELEGLAAIPADNPALPVF